MAHVQTASTAGKSTDTYQRLPLNPRPIHYDLLIEPDLVNFSYCGRVKVNIEILNEINKFSIYSKDLQLSDAKVIPTDQLGNLNSYEPMEIAEEKDERIQLRAKGCLKPGNYTLSLAFKGILDDKLNGFYRSTYKAEDGKTEKVMALTQFEPTYARRAFPCWDEPSFKATFDVTIIAPSELTSLSNMPILREELLESRPGFRQVWFDTSPKMSTYLLAFIVGDLAYTETVDSNGVRVRVYTRRGCEEQGRFSLEVASKVLPYYATYFGIKYPLPKLDLAAIPDFSAGAMENWGLITYRDTALLVDPLNTSKASRQYVALVVGHELAHQWFGNLVTMDWWTDLWLNEGFASWIEFLSVDSLFPNLDIWTQFVFMDLRRALDLDGLRSSHPIEVEVGSPDEIDQIFDSISYSKGASVIRMLHDHMGDEKFRSGLRTYLNEYKYANAETKDLWKHLSQAAGYDIGAFMRKWTQSTGYPLLKVNSMIAEGDNLLLNLSQSRFLLDGDSGQSVEDSKEYVPWHIPVSVRYASNPQIVAHKFVLSRINSTVTLPNAGSEKWIKVNADSVGFYITQYPANALDSLISAVPSLSNLDRFGLQSDLSMLCKSGHASFVDYLKLCRAYTKSETDYTVWRDIVSNIQNIRILVEELGKQEPLSRLNQFEIDLLKDTFNTIGSQPSESEDDLVSMLRGVLYRVLGLAKYEPVVQECIRMFESNSGIDPNLRSAVYSVVAKHDVKYLDELMKRHKKAELAEEKNRLLGSMGLVIDKQAKLKVLEYTIGENVRNQDIFYGFLSVAGSDKAGRDITWKFFKDNFDTLNELYKETNMLSTLIKRSFSYFCDIKVAQEMQEFFSTHSVPSARMAINQVLETIKTNSQAYERDASKIEQFLNAESDSA